jgi:hypothetical protein
MFFINTKKKKKMAKLKNNMGTALHMQYDLPGGIYNPPLIDIVERKISLMHSLMTLKNCVSSENWARIDSMIGTELNVIEEIIKIDQ